MLRGDGNLGVGPEGSELEIYVLGDDLDASPFVLLFASWFKSNSFPSIKPSAMFLPHERGKGKEPADYGLKLLKL